MGKNLVGVKRTVMISMICFTMILSIVSSFAATGNGTTLRIHDRIKAQDGSCLQTRLMTQDQLKVKDCDATCVPLQTRDKDCLQAMLQTRDQLKLKDCDATCVPLQASLMTQDKLKDKDMKTSPLKLMDQSCT
jgi:prolyl-tRNA synthetase